MYQDGGRNDFKLFSCTCHTLLLEERTNILLLTVLAWYLSVFALRLPFVIFVWALPRERFSFCLYRWFVSRFCSSCRSERYHKIWKLSCAVTSLACIDVNTMTSPANRFAPTMLLLKKPSPLNTIYSTCTGHLAYCAQLLSVALDAVT